MNKIIGVTELQRRFRSVFDEVSKRRAAYVLTRGSRPEAALISYEDFLDFQRLQETQVLERFQRMTERMSARNRELDDDEVEADARAARDERRGR
ncbi:MAG: type II toxin-antitoxin system Phd/YefM family antitoxin [Deltaproteobacteria bacterium]|nr:type II toxin-antitoxin system Phd/YefM family antitoxin [Deltaproteobacteria bacterium]